MPCNDITETLLIKLDNHNNIRKYSLTKRTCGAEVIEKALLQDIFNTYDSTTVLNWDTQKFLDIIDIKISDKEGAFPYLKHFDILKKSVDVLLGTENGNVGSDIVIEDLIANDKGIYATLYIKIGLDTKNIQACGSMCS